MKEFYLKNEDKQKLISNTINEVGLGYFDRKSGSRIVYTGQSRDFLPEDAVDLLGYATWREITDAVKTLAVYRGVYQEGFRYFRFNIPGALRGGDSIQGIQGVAKASALSPAVLSEARLRVSEHGQATGDGDMELVHPGIGPTDVDYGHVITKGDLIATWYPGELLPYIDLRLATVKLVGA